MDSVIAEFAKLAFSNMLDYTTTNADGLADVNFSKASRDQFAAVPDVKLDRARTLGGG
jgi:hypothetical protein